MEHRRPGPGPFACRRSAPGARAARRRGGLALVLMLAPAAARGEWPLIWDFDGRSDTPTAALLAPGGDLLVAVEAYVQGATSPRAVLVRIDPGGQVVWATADPDLPAPSGLALAGDGRALVIGRSGVSTLRASSFTAAGALEWSRTRGGLAPDLPGNGPAAQPVWDAAAGAWRIPAGLGGDFAVLSWTAAGDPLPDRIWSPPAGEATATAVAPRPSGGLLVTGSVELTVPGWWTVALDDAGVEDWSRFEDGGTNAGIFSGAFPLVVDAQRVTVWADDETACGLFSLRLWSLDAATGAPLWDATWPEPSGCEYFIPDVVRLAGDRIVASGATSFFAGPSNPDTAALSFEAATGLPVWARNFHGDTSTIRADVASFAGSALVASTLFPSPNPGPSWLWLSAWNREGVACGAPFELLPARVAASFTDAAGRWLVVGAASSLATADDVVVQLVSDPCRALFADGFESGDLGAWSSSVP